MPTNLANQTIIQAFRQKRALAQAQMRREILRGQSPWLGYAPDLDPRFAQLIGFRTVEGLIQQPFPQRGVVLRPDFGFARLDPTPTKLPLGAATLPSSAGNEKAVIRLDSFYRTNSSGSRTADEDLTLMAITEGDGTNGGGALIGSCKLYRLNPQTEIWGEDLGGPGPYTPIPYGGATAAATATRDGITTTASATAKSMPDTVTVPFGIGGPIPPGVNAPVWVWCNNKDRVYIYPDAAGTGGSYDDYPSGTLDPFIARSCTVWIGRVWFLNTSEAGSRFTQRLRRSAALDGRIAPNVAGTGTLDFRDFDGEGIAVRPLGDHLAVYFADGVGLVIRPTGDQPPVATRVITKERGLLGTHAVCSIGPAEHFGIYTDGFFILNAAGQFNEIGLYQTQDGQPQHLFRDTFFDQLDQNRVHEIQTVYEQQRYVRIAWPNVDGDTVVWTFDVRTGTMWPMDWTATCFTNFPVQTTSSGTIDGLDALTGDIDTLTDIAPSIDELGQSSFGLKRLIHGTEGGLVMYHDRTILTRDGVEPAWSFQTHRIIGRELSKLYTADRIGVGHLGGGPTSMSIGVRMVSGQSDVTISLEGTGSNSYTNYAWFKRTGDRFGIIGSGSGDVRITALELWLREHMSRRRGL